MPLTVPSGTLPRRVQRRSLILLLALASLLRLVLVVQGGQLYWPDERLYTQVVDIFDLHRGSWFEIVKALFATQDHLGFALISAIPAAIQVSLGHALSRSGNGLMILPGILLSQISVISIALAFRKWNITRSPARTRIGSPAASALSLIEYRSAVTSSPGGRVSSTADT